jgi:hypothetical protein
MPDFTVRSDSVNVEHIMEQIRARISEKRGVDYTEQQIRELAAVKLEKFLDPRGVRSDLLDQFRKAQPAYEPPELPNFAFEDETLFESHRGPIRWIRKLLLPLLKLFFNPNPLIQALHIQSRLNTMNAERDAKLESARRAMDQLYYELIHNLVVETTRLGIEVKNLKMRVESMSSRLDFDERRARALEGVVQYRPGAVPPLQPPTGVSEERVGSEGDPSERRTRRRRRRGRRRPDDRGPRLQGAEGARGAEGVEGARGAEGARDAEGAQGAEGASERRVDNAPVTEGGHGATEAAPEWTRDDGGSSES